MEGAGITSPIAPGGGVVRCVPANLGESAYGRGGGIAYEWVSKMIWGIKFDTPRRQLWWARQRIHNAGSSPSAPRDRLR